MIYYSVCNSRSYYYKLYKLQQLFLKRINADTKFYFSFFRRFTQNYLQSQFSWGYWTHLELNIIIKLLNCFHRSKH